MGFNASEIRKRIKGIRGEYSQAFIAQLAGCEPSTVSKIEIGTMAPPLDFLFYLSNWGNISLDYIIKGTTENKRESGKTDRRKEHRRNK